MKKPLVFINLRNATLEGIVERVEGQNAFVTVGNDIMKFHTDQLEFRNEVQQQRFEKMSGIKVSMSKVMMSLSLGNKKLKDSASVRFYQWNITSVVSCPYRTVTCEKLCYALKAEKMYPTVASRRASNFEFSKSINFVPAMIEQIEHELSRPRTTGKKVYFRIHEAGDFYSYEYLAKWHEIAMHFEGNKGIVFMAYTKSLPFVKTLYKKLGEATCNITFKSSIWEDTKTKFVGMTKELGMSVFTAVDKGEIKAKGYFACPSSDAFKDTPKAKDCGACGVCYISNVDVAIEIH